MKNSKPKKWSDLIEGDPIFRIIYVQEILTEVKVLKFSWAGG